MYDCRFSIGNKFRWNDVDYRVIRSLPNNQVNIENLDTTALLIIDESELVKALFGDTLKFHRPPKPDESAISSSPYGPVGFGKHTVVKTREFSDYTPYQQMIAQYRLEIILHAPKGTTEERQAYVGECKQKYPGMPISLASLYRWEKLYFEYGQDIRVLCPQTERKNRRGTYPDEVEEIITSVLNDKLFSNVQNDPQPSLPSGRELHDEVKARIKVRNDLNPSLAKLITPSRRKIERRRAELDAFELYEAQFGRKAAKDQYRQFGQFPRPIQPLDEVEVDFTRSDLIVVDSSYLPLGRPLYGRITDRKTGYTTGASLGFEPESALSVTALLYNSIIQKDDAQERYGLENPWLPYGVPRVVYVDNSRAHRGNDLLDACNSLGIRVEPLASRTPQAKPMIERGFRTTNEALFHTLPGTTFSNILQRRKYDSVEHAVINLDQLNKMLHIYLIDEHAQSFHRGINAIPARAWEKAVKEGFRPRLPFEREELYILLARVAYRVLFHYGLELFNLKYNLLGINRLSEIRAEMDRRKARHTSDERFSYKLKLKYHADNLQYIYVKDPFIPYEYIKVPAVDQEYTAGLSLWQHMAICRNARHEEKSVDTQALVRARHRIQDIMFEAITGKQASKRTHHDFARATGGKGTAYQPPQQDDSAQSQLKAPAEIPQVALLPHPDLNEHLNKIIENARPDGWETGPSLADK